MIDPKDPVYRALWADNLEKVDREIARFSPSLPGEDPRTYRYSTSAAKGQFGMQNPAGFVKLQVLLMLHLAIRQKSIDPFGQAQTAAIEGFIIERLRKSFPEALAGQLPGQEE